MPNSAALPVDPSVLALQEAARRAARGGAPRTALLLHLDAVGAIRPHHLRVARAILADIAQRLEGEVFRLQTGELVLLCRHRRPLPDRCGPDGAGADGLPAVLCRLFGLEPADTARLFTLFHLPEQNEALHRRLQAPPSPSRFVPAADEKLDSTYLALAAEPVPALLQRESAVRLTVAKGRRVLEPSFRVVRFASSPASASRRGGPAMPVDPYLRRYVAGCLDRRLMAAVTRQLEQGGLLEGLESGRGGTLHLHLSPAAVLSPDFAPLLAACRGAGLSLGAEIALADLCADPQAATQVRQCLAAAGARFAIDEVTPEALRCLHLGAFGADLIKLRWSPEMANVELAAKAVLRASVRALGAARLVLEQTETDTALRWGLGIGIGLFQGRHVDAMLAASRIAACLHSGNCAFTECIDRAASLDAAGRAGCQDRPLLDGAVGSAWAVAAG